MAEDGETPEDGETGYTPVLAFDSDDPEFTRGFNGGCVYGYLTAVLEFRGHMRNQLAARGANVQETELMLEMPFAVRPDNVEMVLRIAEALGIVAIAEEDGRGPGGAHLDVKFRLTT